MSAVLKTVLFLFLCAACAAIFRCILRRGGGKAFFLSALQGTAAMFAVNVAGTLTGISIAVNPFSALTSVLCGLPGVAGLLFLNIMLG